MRADRRRRARVALCAALLVTGACRDEIAEIERVQRSGTDNPQLPAAAVGQGTDPETGLPVGYPPELPLVPGGRALGGGVDPGVIRIATVLYPNTTIDAYLERLRAALAERGQRVSTDFETRSGSRQLRVQLESGSANVIVAREGDAVRVDVSMLDRTPR